MKVLSFGQTGQVAKALAKRAGARNISIVQHDRQTADLSDPARCAALVAETDADAVINAAAWTAVDAAEEAEEQAYRINAVAPGAMAQAAAARDIPFVHISTDYVFPGTAGPPWKPSDPTGPLNAYGRSKVAGEQAVLDAGGVSAILRTAWVFDGHGRNFVTTMVRLARTHYRLQIVADQHGGPTPAFAIADACLTMAKTLRTAPECSGVYHLCGAPYVSWADFARAIFARSGDAVIVEDIATADYPTPARRPLNSRLDCSATRLAFGIDQPDWGAALDQIIKETRS